VAATAGRMAGLEPAASDEEGEEIFLMPFACVCSADCIEARRHGMRVRVVPGYCKQAYGARSVALRGLALRGLARDVVRVWPIRLRRRHDPTGRNSNTCSPGQKWREKNRKAGRRAGGDRPGASGGRRDDSAPCNLIDVSRFLDRTRLALRKP